MSNLFCDQVSRSYPKRPLLEACLVALLLILAAFPDVLFNGASLRLTDQVTGAVMGLQKKSVYPIPMGTDWWGGYNDSGGATYQSDPMIQFMAHTLRNGESPYWNPYSAAGALGPEALVDQKFSALTVVSALFGGSSLSFNIAIMIALYFGVFFIYRTVREVFGLSSIAAASAATFYLLNGYITANLGSNVTQSYLYIPVCLYTALVLIDRLSVLTWSMAVLAFALFFSCTFMPTTITGLLAIGLIVVGCLIASIQTGKYSVKQGFFVLAVLATSVLASGLLLAPLYFPFLENLKSLGTLDDYSKRIFWGLRFPNALASFYTPSYLFESYNAMEPAAAFWDDAGSITGNSVFHSGVVAIALASCAFSARLKHFKWLVSLCALGGLFIVVRLFDPVWIHWLFSYLPIVGNIGSQYWWPVIMLAMVVLVGFGVNNLQQRDFYLLPYIVFMAILVASLVYLFNLFGLHAPALEYKTNSLYFIVATVVLMSVVVLTLKYVPRTAKCSGAVFLVVLITLFVELLGWGKMSRFERSDVFDKMPVAIQFVKDNIGHYRTLNFGQGGLDPELGSAYQIQEVSTMNQGNLPAFNDFFYSTFNLANTQRIGYDARFAPRGSFPTFMLIQDKPNANSINWEAVDVLGVKYVLLPVAYSAYKEELKRVGFVEAYESLRTVVMENTKVLPRAFSVRMAERPDNNSAKLPPGFRNTLVPAVIETYRNSKVVLSGDVTEESLVFLSDNWHSNWSALLNGKKAPIIKVENTFRGVIVPPGHYTITMEYQPKSLSWALGCSLLIVLLLISLGLYSKRTDELLRERLAAFH
ncbi:YfhO family protein [Pseudomonas sp. OE 28.3]|uniref:hypothetical protein n=1 Tax=Pseudomonas sp. OE 28.3 TaxID=2745519 RepID=UPI001647BF04|nr:hypothetical protein [Pseudomonas sp. OE 28.3]QXI57798.1 YfhO family protein [Pseudomonas sp. OE 28.3]